MVIGQDDDCPETDRSAADGSPAPQLVNTTAAEADTPPSLPRVTEGGEALTVTSGVGRGKDRCGN